MKVKFENYTYWDKNASDKAEYNGIGVQQYDPLRFDSNHFNKLISQRRYMEAADYASQYVFTGQTQIDHESDIINLRRNGHILGAIYNRIEQNDPTKKTLKEVEFYDNVFVNGGLENIQDNPYVDEFIKYKRRLGSKYTYTDEPIETEATRLAIKFAPKKRYGIFGIDFLAADNPNDITNFYNKINVTKDELLAAGVQVKQIDGNDVLEFDKTNKYANLIIASCNSSLWNVGVNHDIPVSIIGYDKQGNIIKNNNGETESSGRNELDYIDDLISHAKNKKDEAFKKLHFDNKEYSSASAPWISDELIELRKQATSEEEYNKLFKTKANDIYEAINSIGSSNYEIYSNVDNEEGDETLMPITNSKTKSDIISRITGTAPSKYQIDAMTSNGKVGALITLYERRANNGDLIAPRVQVFIPGVLTEQAQARLNRDTNIRAIQELNSMLDWGYNYNLDDGSTISVSNGGGFEKDGQPIDKEEAIRNLNKNFILQDLKNTLKYNFINNKGELVNAEQYELVAERSAIGATIDMYPNVVKAANNQESVIINNNSYNISDIFNNNITAEEVPFKDWDIIQNIMSIYNALLNDLTYYKN